MSALARRSEAQEQMDADDLSVDVYAALLADLARVNAVTLAARPTLAFLARLVPRGGRLRLLDVGFGHGDMLRRIARWAERRGVQAELTGIDCNPRSAAIARAATPATLPIEYRTGDYRATAGEGWDAIVSSLVAHHMSRAELIDFLRFMEVQAGRGWFVNDLHRHGFAYRCYPLLARAMGWHRIVREDGTLSIARSFRAAEWRELLDEAAIPPDAATVRRAFPFRLCVARAR